MTDFKDFSSKLRKYKRMLTLKNLFVSCVVTLIVVGCGACGSNQGKRLKISGDSVSIYYTSALKSQLEPNGWEVKHVAQPGQAGIDFTNSDNAMSTTNTLQKVDGWLSDTADIIVWNNGIWDCTDQPTSPQQYAQNITAIAIKMKATGARVIFVTTTEVKSHPGCAEERNGIARQVLQPMGVEILDLYAFTKPHPEWHGRDDTPNPSDVHYTRAASIEIAKFLAAYIEGRQ